MSDQTGNKEIILDYSLSPCPHLKLLTKPLNDSIVLATPVLSFPVPNLG